MIQYLENLKAQITQLWQIHTLRDELTEVRITESFDVVERVSAYTGIKVLTVVFLRPMAV